MRYSNYIYAYMVLFLLCVNPCFAGPIASGDYVMSNFGDNVDQVGTPGQSADDPVALLTEITLDGQGNGTFQDLYASDNDLESGTFTYTIADDGSLIFNIGGGEVHGIVSSDGNIFSVALTSSSEPGIIIGIKKSPVVNLSLPILILEN